ncbi:hypothetical protein Trydic_g21125 [Trypoxylus dichotomus]
MYTNILQTNFILSADMMGLTGIQHDGDPKQKTKSVKNPIEHLWTHLKKDVPKQKPTSISNLNQIIDNEWYKILLEYTKKSVESMPRRCQAVIETKGGHAGY